MLACFQAYVYILGATAVVFTALEAFLRDTRTNELVSNTTNLAAQSERTSIFRSWIGKLSGGNPLTLTSVVRSSVFSAGVAVITIFTAALIGYLDPVFQSHSLPLISELARDIIIVGLVLPVFGGYLNLVLTHLVIWLSSRLPDILNFAHVIQTG